MKTKLILIGGGGHCKSCIDVIESTANYEISGILDRQIPIGDTVLGYKVIGRDDNLEEYIKKGYHFLITVGQIKSASVRKRIFENLVAHGANIAIVISATAKVSRHAEVGVGSIVMHNAIVNAAAKVGCNAIINTGANIEHDVTVGDHCHISTHAVVNGDCVVGNEVFVGSNVTINSQVSVGNGIVIGAGAVINRNITQAGVYVGNPAKYLN